MTRPKKSPATTSKKKTTASARAKNSTRKLKSKEVNLDGSFLTASGRTTVSNGSYLPQNDSSEQPPQHDAVMAYLKKIDATNQALLKRVDDLESHRAQATARQGFQPNLPTDHTTIRTSPSDASTMQPVPATSIPTLHTGVTPALNLQLQHTTHQDLPSTQSQSNQQSSTPHDAVIPDLAALRSNPVLSNTVTNMMSAFETHARSEALQGKPLAKKSGRYNTTDSITSAPEFRWPNEGYHAMGGRKRVLYDDLTMQEWAVGQLSNIYHIQGPNMVKQSLLQVILSLRDATSLPWQAVRGAWANSMHELEQGHLRWGDATQWALNRLSTSQIAMANSSHLNPQPTTKKVCKYYNENCCSHKGNHGQYRHVCAFCTRQGKSYTHPETSCNIKARGGDRNGTK